MDTSRRIDCYLGLVHWLIASSGLFLADGYLGTDLLTDSWTKCSPLYSLLADCSENTFCKGPVVTETLPANALYYNSIPLLFSWLTHSMCNCCVIAWFVVGELYLVAPLSREQSYMRPQYPGFPAARHNTLWK
jgi:hypothetical protein